MVKMPKKVAKRKRPLAAQPAEEEGVVLPAKRMSDDPIPAKAKWTNKQRVLVFGARGISYRDRHLMQDLKKLMPHHKTESKMERSKSLTVINEMCEIKHCNKAVLFEGRKQTDLYMWCSNVPSGPSVKFLVENIYTMAELKLTGNCLRGSRPLLSFDPTFAEKPHYKLMKELLTQTFGVPNHHPKSQPFFDHVYSFTVLDNRVWFRNYQILNDEGALAEVGPRFVLNPVKIFSGSFTGTTLWENPFYLSPSRHRRQINLAAKGKYVNRQEQMLHAEATRPKESYKMTPLEDIFSGDAYEKAKAIQKELGAQTKDGKLTKQNGKSQEKKKKKADEELLEEDEDDDDDDDEDEDNFDVEEDDEGDDDEEDDFDVEEDGDDDEDDFDEEENDDDDEEDVPEEEAEINIKNLKDTLKKLKAKENVAGKNAKTNKIGKKAKENGKVQKTIKNTKVATKVVTKVKKKAVK